MKVIKNIGAGAVLFILITPLLFAAPLHEVLEGLEPDIAEIKDLVNKGANVNELAESIVGTMALPLQLVATVSTESKEKVEIARVLLEAGAKVNAQDPDGNTPLHTAALADEPDLVTLLLEAGAEIDVRNNEGRTPLHEAATASSVEAARVLLKNGAEVKAKDHKGNTALLLIKTGFTAEQAEIELMKLLIAKAAEVNCQNNAGWTPLHFAALQASMYPEKIEVVRLLLDAGAQRSLKTKDGKMPVDIAFNPEVKKLLAISSAGEQTSFISQQRQQQIKEIVSRVNEEIDEVGRDYFSNLKIAMATRNLGAIKRSEDIKDKISVLNNFIDSAKRLRTVIGAAHTNATKKAEAKGVQASQALNQEVEQMLSVKGTKKGIKMVNLYIRWAEAMIERFKLLRKSWGSWSLNYEERMVDTEDLTLRKRLQELTYNIQSLEGQIDALNSES